MLSAFVQIISKCAANACILSTKHFISKTPCYLWHELQNEIQACIKMRHLNLKGKVSCLSHTPRKNNYSDDQNIFKMSKSQDPNNR